jgi:hypothetical protein
VRAAALRPESEYGKELMSRLWGEGRHDVRPGIQDFGPRSRLGGTIILRAQKSGANIWFSPDWPNHGLARE